MLLIIGLGMIGIVNGLWSKNLIVTGTVETGDLNADWDCAWTNDDGVNFVPPTSGPCSTVAAETGDSGLDPRTIYPDGSNPWGFSYHNPFVPKDVGECTVTIDEEDAQIASVVMTNAYPSYECSFTLALSNTGSIPFNIAGGAVVVNGNVPVEALGDDCGLQQVQVDPGEEQLLTCTLHVMQEAAQSDCTGTTDESSGHVVVTHNCNAAGQVRYTATAKVCVAQWNEEADFEACVLSEQHEGPDFAP
jgi:hypothetical protein